jgi:uncharacterized protein YjiS (DUF1127 family)
LALASTLCIFVQEPPVFVASIIAKIQSYLRYRETVRELSKLSDRELDDLGIVRSNITDIARHYSAA